MTEKEDKTMDDSEAIEKKTMSPEEIEIIQKHNRAAEKHLFEEFKKLDPRLRKIEKDWQSL